MRFTRACQARASSPRAAQKACSMASSVASRAPGAAPRHCTWGALEAGVSSSSSSIRAKQSAKPSGSTTGTWAVARRRSGGGRDVTRETLSRDGGGKSTPAGTHCRGWASRGVALPPTEQTRNRTLPLLTLALLACREPPKSEEPRPGEDSAAPEDSDDADDTALTDDSAEDAGCPRRSWFQDADGDGYDDINVTVESCAPVEGFGDCADDDPDTPPGAEERCDAVDNNWDGTVDEGADCEVCDGQDDDGDGRIDEGFDADGDGVARCCDPASAFFLAQGDARSRRLRGAGRGLLRLRHRLAPRLGRRRRSGPARRRGGGERDLGRRRVVREHRGRVRPGGRGRLAERDDQQPAGRAEPLRGRGGLGPHSPPPYTSEATPTVYPAEFR
ncbi:MAG: putative metal-binding motif-containing protein [Alphaproteobacteria bacterium]|nr:putative metal-binding motif-containing protein [Alphaproteobacteria bacterium]